MDEVDKIIIHSLRQIGCNIDGDVFSLSSFTPDLLVHTVSACLQEIKPASMVPTGLPEGMTQRFAVASSLADICSAVGYRSDIGYQTFLYPNVVDVRKLFMFLIEILPKESRESATTVGESLEGDLSILEREIKKNILQSLRSPWVPPYCRQRLDPETRKSLTQYVNFKPQLNLNIPTNLQTEAKIQYLVPNIFQQMTTGDFDLISSVLHKNDMDLCSSSLTEGTYEKIPFIRPASMVYEADVKPAPTAEVDDKDPKSTVRKTPMQSLTDQVNELKIENDDLITARKSNNSKLNDLKSLQSSLQATIAELRKTIKMHEKTCVVLENPETNLEKLEDLVKAAQEKRTTLEQQWEDYREPLEKRRKNLLDEKQANKTKTAMDYRENIIQLENTIKEKTVIHAKLNAELSRMNNAATRKEYTRRIMEFIGNIRKQRNDIYKVLDDTRDLQKQINTVSAQLQRQFNYTDDLLFKSAKHDIHSRNAYKLLAAVHAACNELVELVSQTGTITKEIRDLEVHIDREKIKNIAVNLEKISFDIRNFENVIKNIQTKINKVENRITEG